MFEQANNEITESNLLFYMYEKRENPSKMLCQKCLKTKFQMVFLFHGLKLRNPQSSFRVCSSVYNCAIYEWMQNLLELINPLRFD